MKAYEYFTPAVQDKIAEAIRKAESKTSGEIRLHVEDHCEVDPVDRAVQVFEKLNMQNTKERNGVLFYVAVTSRKFSVIGDSGIHQKVGSHYWNEILGEVMEYIKSGSLAEGLCAGIVHVGKELGTYFPLQKNDRNELTDDISFG